MADASPHEPAVTAPGTAPAPPDPAPGARDAGAEPPAASRPARSGPHPVRALVEWVVILAVALAGAFAIRAYAVQAFYIPSGSMIPALEIHDRVLVNKLSYDLHAVHRGDIVVFTRSPGVDPAIKDLIKRVIALPGETVSGKDGHVYIDGRLLNEPYLPDGTFTAPFPSRVVPAHAYWVMGDNRTNSTDSRVFGPIAHHQIVGRAFVLIWPLSHLHLL